MPIYQVTTLDTFKMHYLVEASTPEAAEHLALVSRDAQQDEWIQSYNGEFVTKVEEVLLTDPEILARHAAEHRTRPIEDYVVSEKTLAAALDTDMLALAHEFMSRYDAALVALADAPDEPTQLSLPF